MDQTMFEREDGIEERPDRRRRCVYLRGEIICIIT